MADERIDIEIGDKVSSNVQNKILLIAEAARSADSGVSKLKANLASINSSGLDKLAAASSKVTNALARETNAQARLTAANAKMTDATNKAALSKQRLATEAERTTAAQARATAANESARAATARAELAEIRLAKAKQQNEASTSSLTREGEKLKRSLFPLYDAHELYNEAVARANMLHKQGAIDTQTYNAALDRARGELEATAAATRAYDNVNAKFGKTVQLNRQHLVNLGFQLQDIGVSLASGQNPLLVFVQQGAQIAGIASQAGIGLGAMLAQIGKILARFIPFVAVLGVGYSALKLFTSQIEEGADLEKYARDLGATGEEIKKLSLDTVTFGDVMRGLWKTISDNSQIDEYFAKIKDLGISAFKALLGVVKLTAASIVALFQAALTTVLNLWETFPDRFSLFITRALNLGAAGLEVFVNTFISGFNEIIKLVNEFSGADFDLAESFSISRIDTTPFENTGASVADVFVNAYVSSLRNNENSIDGFFKEVAENTEKAAKERITKALTPDATVRAEGLAKVNRELESEIRLLKLIGPEREVQQRFEEINNQLLSNKIRLTSEEKRGLLEKLQLIQSETQIQGQLEQIYDSQVGQYQQIAYGLEAANRAYAQGILNAEQYKNQLVALNLEAANLKLQLGDGTFEDLMLASVGRIVEGYENMLSGLNDSFGGFFDSMADGFADSIGRAIVYSDNLGDSLRDVARSALSELISSLVKLGIQYVVNAALGQTIAASTAATNATIAGSAAVAWAPAAALASLATLGTNAAGAAAAITGTMALSQGLAATSLAGFESGGYTGNVGTKEIAGVVHGKEFVVNAAATARNRDTLEAMNRGATSVSTNSSNAGSINSGTKLNVYVENYGSSEISVEQLSETDVRIIAKDVASKAVRDEAPSVIASDIANPNGRVSRSMSQNTKVERRR